MELSSDDCHQAKEFLLHYSHRTEENIRNCYQHCHGPHKLLETMRYSSLSAGKKIRPGLVYATALAYNIELIRVDAIACAVELLHSYSLVHDDLPAMDDDDFRRGQPSTHKQFDEALAILAGDAMHALAFEVLTQAPQISTHQQVQIMGILAKAGGNEGMCGGQVLDISGDDTPHDIASLEKTHLLKTATLFSACIQMTLACTEPAVYASEQEQLLQFAQKLGLCFQIRDDLLDYDSESQQGAHSTAPTYPRLLGLKETQRQLLRHTEDCLQLLQQLSGDTENLRQITHYIAHRTN